jgi:hypothetical protein
MSSRRFPPPWSVEETDACFIVKDATVQALAYHENLDSFFGLHDACYSGASRLHARASSADRGHRHGLPVPEPVNRASLTYIRIAQGAGARQLGFPQ